jgi:hypothetical protein
MDQRVPTRPAEIRRVRHERVEVHLDAPAAPEAWRGDAIVRMWPNLELAGVSPVERWVPLSTGSVRLFLQAHAWLPADHGRYRVVRLAETADGAVRAVDLGRLPLAGAVGLLGRPIDAPRRDRARLPRRPARPTARIAAELAALLAVGVTLAAGGWAAALLSLSLAAGGALR